MENEKTPITISYFAHEGVIAHMERTQKRLWILCIILIVCLVGTNAVWLWYNSQFEDVVTTREITQELSSQHGNAVINDGVHINGTGEADSKDNN